MLLLVIQVILLVVTVSECVIDTCDHNGNKTSTRAKMCQATTAVEDDQDGSENLDSVFLSLMKKENNCYCNVSVKHTHNLVKLNIKRLNNFTEQSLCGMEIDVNIIRPNETILTELLPTNCNSTKHSIEDFSLHFNEYLQFTSRVIDGVFSYGYCIQIEREHTEGEEGSSLEISCGTQSLTTSTDIPIHAKTTFSDTTTNPQTTPMIDKSQINDNTDSDGDSTLYIAVGAGGGFVLFVSLLVVIVLCKRRKSHLSGKEENSANPRANSTADDDDDDGLRYNVMYVSSERHDDIDVNYSTVDGDIPRHIGGGDEGGYSTVDDNKNIQDTSLNTRQFPNTGLEVKDDDDVEHINAPTESGCVYAVVDKSHKINSSDKNIKRASTSAVYAVVDKDRVRHFDEGNK